MAALSALQKLEAALNEHADSHGELQPASSDESDGTLVGALITSQESAACKTLIRLSIPQESSLASTPSHSRLPSPRKAASKRPPQVSPLRISEVLNQGKTPSKRASQRAPAPAAAPQAAPVPQQAPVDPQHAFNTQLLEAQVARLQQEAAAREARIQRLHAQCQREEAAAGAHLDQAQH